MVVVVVEDQVVTASVVKEELQEFAMPLNVVNVKEVLVVVSLMI
jgi:hypothetical protein